MKICRRILGGRRCWMVDIFNFSPLYKYQDNCSSAGDLPSWAAIHILWSLNSRWFRPRARLCLISAVQRAALSSSSALFATSGVNSPSWNWNGQTTYDLLSSSQRKHSNIFCNKVFKLIRFQRKRVAERKYSRKFRLVASSDLTSSSRIWSSHCLTS